MNEAQAIFFAFQVWCSIGAIIALFFLTIGIDRIDEDAQGAYVFRILLVPAILLIWPLVLWRWFILETKRDAWPNRHSPPRHAHFWVAIIFALAIPGIIMMGLAIKQTWPTQFEPQKLSLLEEQSQ